MNCVAALSTPQGCWMFTCVRLKADAIVESPVFTAWKNMEK